MRLERLKLYDAQIALLFARSRGSGSIIPPGTGVLIDNGGTAHVLPVAPGQTAVGGPVPIARGIAPVFNVQSFGALGDGVTIDRVAIVAADAAAAAAGGGEVFFPTTQKDGTTPVVAYLSDQELVPTPGNKWVGEASVVGQSTIRASVAMRSVVAVHATNSTPGNPTPVYLEGLTLDANHLAMYALLRNSDWLSIDWLCFFQNAVLDAVHAVGHRLPLLLSAVTPGGGNTSPLISISQPTSTYTTLTSVTNIVVKMLDASHYVASFDGGATFATFSQGNATQSNLIVASLGTGLNWSGIQIHCPPGVYAANDTWSFSATVQSEDTSPNAINVESTLELCWATDSGYTYFAGTVTTTVGSQLIVGVATNWLSGPPVGIPGTAAFPRPGDTMSIPGAGNFVVAAILDDTHLMVHHFATPNAAVAGAAYRIDVGFGYYEDDGGDEVRNAWNAGVIRNCVNGMRLAGDNGGGATVRNVRIENYTGAGIVLGGVDTIATGILLEAIELKPPPLGAVFVYRMPNVNCLMLEPRQNIDATQFAGPGNVRIFQNGTDYTSNLFGISSLTPISSLTYTDSTDTVPNPAHQFNPPDLFGPNPFHTSYLRVHLTASVDITSVPSILPAARIGMVLVLENQSNSTGYLGLSDQSVGSTQLNLEAPQIALGPGERVAFIATNDVFNPKWSQHGPVSKIWAGTADNGSGSSEGSSAPTLPDAAVHTIYRFPITFNPTNGFTVDVDVAIHDNASAAYATWSHATASVNQAGALVGSFVPTTNAQGAYGSNAGLPPAGWVISFAIVAGELALQATTGAAITAPVYVKARMISARRV